MTDESNYFRNKYSGSLVSYTVTDLYRNTEYKFRVRELSMEWLVIGKSFSLQLSAHNQEGQSNYSQSAVFRTLPDRPDPPAKPRIKGHIQATQCRITWGKEPFEPVLFLTVESNLF